MLILGDDGVAGRGRQHRSDAWPRQSQQAQQGQDGNQLPDRVSGHSRRACLQRPRSYTRPTAIGGLVADRLGFAVSAAVIVWLGGVIRVAEKVWLPASAAVKA